MICCGVFMFVPETSGKDMPQTLEDFELLFEDGKEEDEEKLQSCLIEVRDFIKDSGKGIRNESETKLYLLLCDKDIV